MPLLGAVVTATNGASTASSIASSSNKKGLTVSDDGVAPKAACSFLSMRTSNQARWQMIVFFTLCTLSFHYQTCMFKFQAPDAAVGPVGTLRKGHAPNANDDDFVVAEFDRINQQLLGDDPVLQADYCHICGCPPGADSQKRQHLTVDCPLNYTSAMITESCNYMSDHANILVPLAQHALALRAYTAAQGCSNVSNGHAIQGNGGWCLHPPVGNRLGMITYGDRYNYSIPTHHIAPSQRVVAEFSNVIAAENITSISDYGAGVGQYKAALLTLHPHLTYNAYDGAGNILPYTSGFVQYFDLTLPLALPITDWVLSLEVGEHVPSASEGMLIRNIHRHNCKGVLLSWGVLGQEGHGHINNHSNDYIIQLFQSLGYTYDAPTADLFRQEDSNYWWFTKSIMVFRRNQPIC